MDVRKAFRTAEEIGVIGSPSSTSELSLDILGSAVQKELVGNIGLFRYQQDNVDHYALGQITEIEMQNVWTQDPTMKGIIRQKGEVDPITEQQDTHSATMAVSAVFANGRDGPEPSMLGTIPATGTTIRLLNEEFLHALLEEYREQIFYLGDAYGTDVKLPMWFRHFGTGPHSAGEAYHLGIFGKTGSGKSVLAKMMMLGYARHRNMDIFVLDPQGEFSRDFQNEPTVKRLLFEHLGREVDFHDLQDIVLTGDALFKKVLATTDFLDRLGIYSEGNKMRAANTIEDILKGRMSRLRQSVPDEWREPIKPWDYYEKTSFGRVWMALQDENVLKTIYTSEDPRMRVQTSLESGDMDEYYDQWRGITKLFSYNRGPDIDAVEISDLVEKIGGNDGSVTIVDLSQLEIPDELYWSESMQPIVIGEILERLANKAEELYKQDELLNCLVVLDEAHRLAPQETPESEERERVKNTLTDAVRTTRKYGLGWMFISQTLSSIDSEIIKQIRIYVLGFGLAYGAERRGLMDIISGADEAIRLYEMFRDPHSSLDEKEFPFMAVGPISPLSFSGSPLFFNALRYPDEFAGVNFEL